MTSLQKYEKPTVTKSPVQSPDFCPDCGIRYLDDPGGKVCKKCGYAPDEQNFNRGYDWRAFDDQEKRDKPRVGAPRTFRMHDEGMTTNIDWKLRYGRANSQQRAQIYRLRKWQQRTRVQSATERNLALGLGYINGYFSRNQEIPKIVGEQAGQFYKKIEKTKLIRGRSIILSAYTAIYAANRQIQSKKPITLQMLADDAGLDPKAIARMYRFFCRELDWHFAIQKHETFASSLVNRLEMKPINANIANRILEVTREMKLTSGRGPSGLAAAAVYIAGVLTNDRRTQREIAEKADVTEVTIRNRYKELIEKIFFEIPL